MLPVVRKLISMLPKSGAMITSNKAKIAARLGLGAASVSAKSLARLAANNKATAAFIAYELYGAGSEIVGEMQQADEELSEIIATIGFVPDKVADSDSANDIIDFTEEFQLITNAARSAGGLDNLIELRAALSLSNETYDLYVRTRELHRTSF